MPTLTATRSPNPASTKNSSTKTTGSAFSTKQFSSLQANAPKKDDRPEDKTNVLEKLHNALNSENAKVAKKILPLAGILTGTANLSTEGGVVQKIAGIGLGILVACLPAISDNQLEPWLKNKIPDKASNNTSFDIDKHMIFHSKEFEENLYQGLSVFMDAADDNLDLDLSQIDQPCQSMLLSGPPGTGKTEIAKWTAKKMGIKLEKVDCSVSSAYIGETEKNILKAFKDAKKNHKLLFFDEADSWISSRDFASSMGGARHDKGVVNTLLQQLEESNVPVIFATNSDNIDSAIRSRLRCKIAFPENSAEQNFSIVMNRFKRIKMSPNRLKEFTDDKGKILKELSKVKFAGRDMKNLVNNSIQAAKIRVGEQIRQGLSNIDKSITQNDFLESLKLMIRNSQESKNDQENLAKAGHRVLKLVG